jgi:hypothetical protein
MKKCVNKKHTVGDGWMVDAIGRVLFQNNWSKVPVMNSKTRFRIQKKKKKKKTQFLSTLEIIPVRKTRLLDIIRVVLGHILQQHHRILSSVHAVNRLKRSDGRRIHCGRVEQTDYRNAS